MIGPRKLLKRTIAILFIFYVLLCVFLYFFQERLIFFPDKLDRNYRFIFNQPFKEINIKTTTNSVLNGLLFTSKNSKRLIFYLHGNAGSLKDWGMVAKRYTDLHYNVFILDYPGYGKSEGSISNEQKLFADIQSAYDELKKDYRQDSIVMIGYSVGTGPAAHLAATNHPRLLILQAPYYSLTQMMRQHYPIIPTFLLKYKFNTAEYLKSCRMTVVIFHGNEDEVINYSNSLRLKSELKKGDTLITLIGQGIMG